MTAARPTPRASICSPRGSSPIAARGSTSSSTPRTSSTSASTASASCRSPRCSTRSACRARRSSTPSTTASPIVARQGRLADPVRRRAMARPEADASTSSTPRPARSCSRPARRSRPRAANKAAKDGLKTLLIPTEEIFGRYSALRPGQREDRRDLHRGRRRGLARRISRSSTRPGSTGSSCSTSTTSTPAPGSATR